MPSLPQSILLKGLLSLLYLNLKENNGLYVDNLHWILTPLVGFVNSTSLRVLDLSKNHFNQEIPNWFSNRSTSLLEYLDLRDNSLSGKIPNSLGNLSQMQALLLGVNKLNGTVPKSLGLLSNLFAVSISHNFFTGSLDEAHFSK
ncbi:putative lrr receptor-like serine/threonine-protein kinase [Quercus suber]|uniref:Lrr receptor-like serine/threonine-protein kinase n=1 Tax=Quercus suber TaxID=58331 RepID=A0AAW0J238_QUESU